MDKIICNYPWTHFEANNPNGDVTICCDNNCVLGNVNEQSIMDIWNGEKYQKIRSNMLNEGAYKVCSPNCAVLKGFKSYQNLDWFSNLPADSPVFYNAFLNEKEISEHKLILKSLPRWIRFAYSYICNLDCYHCYQREIRQKNEKLPQNFINQVYDLAEILQVLFYFGGEPFAYKPTIELLTKYTNPYCQNFFVTNATLLNDKIFNILKSIKIGFLSVSVDAAEKETYEKLRKKAKWERLIRNIRILSVMKKQKPFMFTLSMTVNSKNFNQLESFVDLAVSLDAQPIISMVNNYKNSNNFQNEYLSFNKNDYEQLLVQIDNSIEKVKKAAYKDAEILLFHLKNKVITYKNSLLAQPI